MPSPSRFAAVLSEMSSIALVPLSPRNTSDSGADSTSESFFVTPHLSATRIRPPHSAMLPPRVRQRLTAREEPPSTAADSPEASPPAAAAARAAMTISVSTTSSISYSPAKKCKNNVKNFCYL